MLRDPKTLEKDKTKLFLDSLNRDPRFFCWDNNTTGKIKDGAFVKRGGFAIKGGSDILGLINESGRIVAIEVKRNESEMNGKDERILRQKAFLSRIKKMGGIAFMCYDNVTFINGFRDYGIEVNI